MIRVSIIQTRKSLSTAVYFTSRSRRNLATVGDEKRDAVNLSDTFESLGVDEFVVHGLKRAFPHINAPTPMQKEFIPAIMSGKDILLQDRTGTGK